MQEYTYIIIGGGMTGDAAIRGIRQADEEGSIGLFSSESHPPYNRPPLSKDLWKGMDEKKIWRQTESLDLDMHLSTQVTTLTSEENTITTADGSKYSYKKLLLATGGSPITLDKSPEGVNYFRTYEDFQKLRELSEDKDRLAVIGGGFIGSEIAAALALNKKHVSLIFPERGICGKIFPEDLSAAMNKRYEDHDITLFPGKRVTQINKESEEYTVTLDDGSEISAHGVVAGLGIKPNIKLAQHAGLDVGNGIHVNEYLQTSDSDIYAAGDVANFHNPALDDRIRVEHEENANIQGMLAGANMAGAGREYDHLPYFYSDLFDQGYEAVGKTDASYNVIQDWSEKYEKGVLYYLQNDTLKGVLLWNIFGKLDEARNLIQEQGPFTGEDLREKITE
jgi:NADPH-dependent 2,4-dienoyl-CoA reductase/sulfur reductase-like enzyme